MSRFVGERRRVEREMKLLLADEADAAWPPRKEEAACCVALRDDLGRLAPGFCSPECIRRRENWRLLVSGRPIPKGGAPRG